MVKGNIETAWLFDPKKTNLYYRYHKGWNIQALIAYVLGIALPFPGFLGSLGVPGVGVHGRRLFYLGWLLSFSISFVAYIAICTVWPTQNQRLIRERGLKREELVQKELDAIEGNGSLTNISIENKETKIESV